jgi:hypothetical protein
LKALKPFIKRPESLPPPFLLFLPGSFLTLPEAFSIGLREVGISAVTGDEKLS